MIQSKNIVETKTIKKVYNTGSSTVEALNGINITVQAGELLGVMGQSGAGKSTLMHILGCLDRPTEGSYLLSGKDVSSLPDRELSLIRATKIGFVFQTFNLISHYSVFENVAMPFLYQEGNDVDADITSKAKKAIEDVGLTSRNDHKPSELSGGEMQRVAIARALVVEPLLILADEPTGNLDSKTSKDILNLFSELNEQGVTLIVVTHNDYVASICRRIVCLRDGQIESDREVVL